LDIEIPTNITDIVNIATISHNVELQSIYWFKKTKTVNDTKQGYSSTDVDNFFKFEVSMN
jgi:hypothetical protein